MMKTCGFRHLPFGRGAGDDDYLSVAEAETAPYEKSVAPSVQPGWGFALRG
jgi:hypothetical protein